MTERLRIEPATLAHAHDLAPRMRTEDVEEVLASGGFTPLEAILEALALSRPAFALVAGDEVLALWGAAPFEDGQPGAVVWALTGTGVARHRRAFARISRVAVEALLERFGHLFNAVDARYGSALRWVRFLGFDVSPAAPFGVGGLPFHRIDRRASDV